MRRVKENVNKIRNKMGIRKHDDGPDCESGSSSEEEVEGEDDGYKEDDDPNITSVPTSVPQRVSIGDSEKVEPVKERLGDFTGDVKEDPAAPRSTNPPARARRRNGERRIVMRCQEEPKEEKSSEKRTFLTLEEAGLVEISGLSTHDRFLCRLTISSLNLLRVISEQEGVPIEELNAGKVCDWFLKDKLKREQDPDSAVLQWDDPAF